MKTTNEYEHEPKQRKIVSHLKLTKPTYDVESGNQTQATLVGGKSFRHCANPAPISTLLKLVIAPIVSVLSLKGCKARTFNSRLRILSVRS